MLGLPGFPVRFGEKTGDLARDVGQLAQRRERFFPGGVPGPGGDARLRGVVDDKPNLGVPLHGLQRGRQLSGANKDVIGQPGLPHRGDPVLHIFTQQPRRIGLVVDLVTDADQEAPTLAPAESGQGLRHRPIGQVHPADHAGDELVFRGGLEELARLLQARDSLDDHRSVDAVRVEQRLQVARVEAPANRGQVIPHPRILAVGGIPEMVVGIDHHQGTGALATRRPSALSSSHAAGGIGA